MSFSMPERLVVTVPDKHAEWLEEIRVKKGLSSTQDVVRLIIMNEYERSQAERCSSSRVGTLPSESKDEVTVPEDKPAS